MAKIVEGYVRDHPGGIPLSGVDVTIRDDVTGSPVPPGGMIQSSENPTVTNHEGFFSWTTELSPGPLRVEADVNAGVELKVRSGREVMQAGEIFISDIPSILLLFLEGVFRGVGSEFSVNSITSQRAIRVNPGAANMVGRYLQMDTYREIAISENTSLPTRHDIVVVEQYVGGDYIGKQNVAVIQGTVSATDPATNTDPDIFQMPIARVKILQNGTTVTTEDLRVYAAPRSIGEDTVGLPALKQEVLDYIDGQYPGFLVLDDNVSYLATTKKLNFGAGFSLTKTGSDQVNVAVDSVDPIVQTTGKYYKDTNFAYSGAATATERTLGSASVTVPAGTWMIFTLMTTSIRGTGSGGYTRFKITGNGAPSGDNMSSRAYQHDPGKSRQVVLSARHVVTVTTATTFTSNARVVHEGGSQSNVEDGHISLMVI